MKCDKCGYSDNGSGDWAHACGTVAIQRQPVMNERIRALAEQAKVHADYYSMLSDSMEQEIFTEKFAELIVQDLIDSMIKRYGDDDELPIQEIKLFVKEHFGVEE